LIANCVLIVSGERFYQWVDQGHERITGPVFLQVQ